MFKDIAMSAKLDTPGEAMDREIAGTILLLKKQYAEDGPKDIDAINDALRLHGQKLNRARRSLNLKSERDLNLYNLGRLQGCIETISHLANSEHKNSEEKG